MFITSLVLFDLHFILNCLEDTDVLDMTHSVVHRCHLPMLYIGLEYGLTNNSKLAERFFSQALNTAPEDPFVLHEMGVVAFQNAE